MTLAYASHAYPPTRLKLDPGVVVQFCFACNRAPASGENYANEMKLLNTTTVFVLRLLSGYN